MDLRLAVECGLVLLPVRGSGEVRIARGVLRYDPAMARDERVRLVLAALAEKKRTG